MSDHYVYTAATTISANVGITAKIKNKQKKMKELNQGRHQIPKAKQTKGSPWYTGAR